MNLIHAIYTAEDNSSIKATLDNGKEWFMPQPCHSWHDQHLKEFLDGGGIVEPFVAPIDDTAVSTEPTVEERLVALELAATKTK